KIMIAKPGQRHIRDRLEVAEPSLRLGSGGVRCHLCATTPSEPLTLHPGAWPGGTRDKRSQPRETSRPARQPCSILPGGQVVGSVSIIPISARPYRTASGTA